MSRPRFNRILLKLSGEALMGQGQFGIDPDAAASLAGEIAAAKGKGHELCLVVGGGNIFRGMAAAAKGFDRATADYMGMLATVMNALALQNALEKQGVDTRVMSAIPMASVSEPYIRRRALRHLEKGRIVLFAAGTGNPYFTTDTAAALRAAEMGCDALFKGTSVDGIYTADPRLAPAARQLDVIGYEEMLELAHQGAQVMQVRAVELGWINGVVIEVLSSFEDAPGTLIKEDPLVEQRNKVRGLAHDRNVAKITLVDVPDRPGVARSVFEPLGDNGINVDMIVQNVGHGGATDLSFTIPRVELAKAKRILEPLIRELGFREMTTDSSVAKVSIVGAGIQNAPGYAARMFAALRDAGVNIEMISTSEIRITTIIAEDALETALRALHAAFELERPEAIEAAAAG